MKIALGSDHAGYDMKKYLVECLKKSSNEIIDCGVYSSDSADYPDYAKIVCDHVVSREADYGILVCGTGIGISIAANKIKGIRAALCHTEFSARMARMHNNANVLALGGRVIGLDLAVAVADAFLAEKFTQEGRHIRRIDKMMSFEKDE